MELSSPHQEWGKGQGKKVTCYKCKKEGHYLNECDEEEMAQTSNKRGSNFFVVKKQKGQCSDIEEEEEESYGDEDDDTRGSYDHEFTFLQQNVMCSIREEEAIPREWMLLDSQSTIAVFSNAELLTNIRDAKRNLILYCNAWKSIINKKGDLKGYDTVWFYPVGIVNILSLNNVQRKHKVTYDSTLN